MQFVKHETRCLLLASLIGGDVDLSSKKIIFLNLSLKHKYGFMDRIIMLNFSETAKS